MWCCLPLLLALQSAADPFDQRFTGRTLRFDYVHAGARGAETISPDGLRLEGAWAGSRTQLVDSDELGKYRFEVREAGSGALLFARGFASIYGEWETSAEAETLSRAFQESQRFPQPRAPVRLALAKRQDEGGWREVFAQEVEPSGRFVDESPVAAVGTLATLADGGPPATTLDLLVLAEGYQERAHEKFDRDARRLVEALLATEPFARHRADVSVRTLFVPSAEQGISDPRKGVWRRTPLGCSFNAFDSDRYVLTFADRALRELAAQAPCDALVLLFDARKYGGGGIYNLWATCAADTEPAAYVFVHELGHSFAGLGDEYYSSQVAYEDFAPAGSEPWEPNVTALVDPARLKWRDLVEPGTPLPTPWDQAGYDALDLAYQAKRGALLRQGGSEEASEALMREIKAQTAPLLAAQAHAARVGAFEGALYQARGLYRPEVDCIMFTRNPSAFCRVCERAVERAIERFTR